MATNEPLGQMIIEMDISSVGFESSLKDMQKALKNNQQKMKAQMAVYDTLEDKIGKLTANHDGLKDAMKLNEQQLQRLQQAYKDEVAASGASSDKAKELARQVNKTVQEQAKYEAQLNRVTNQLQDAQDGTQELRNEISLLSNESRSIVANFRAQGKELEALEADYHGLLNVVDERNNLIDKEKDKLRRLKQQYGENSDEYRKQVVRIRELETSNEDARRAMDRLEGEMEELTSTSGQLGRKINEVGDKIRDVGQKATVASVGIAGFGIAASKVAKDSDDAFTKMQNAMGLTEKQTEILKKKARGLYKEGYGESLQEVTDTITEVRTNLSELSGKDLKFATKSTMNLATTYEADANEITRGANGVMTSFGMSAKKTYDLLAKSAQNGGNKSKEMFDNLAEYAVNFEGAGFSAQEMMNILTNGIQKGYNFDRLNDTMLEFKLKAEDGGKAYDDAMKSLGNNSEVAAAYKAFEEGKITVADYYKVVQNNLGKIKKEMTTQEYENFGKNLFGTKWEDQGSKVVESMKTVNKEMENVDGTMGKINKNVEESFGQRFRSFLNTAKDSLQPLGQSLLNIGQKYIPPLIAKITELSQWFENLSTDNQKMVLKILATAAAIGPALIVLSSLITVVSKVASVFKLAGTALKLFSGPVGWVVLGLGLLISALKYAYQNSETFRNFVNKLKDGLLAAWEKMKSMNVSAAVKKMWTSVKNWFANGYNTVKAKMVALGAAIKAIWDAIKAKSSSLVKSMWQSVKDFFAGGYNAVKNKMVAVKTMMGNIWDGIKKLVKDKVGNMIDFVKKMPGKMADGVAKGAGALKKGGKTLLNGLIGGVQWGLNKVIKGANKVLGFFGSSKEIESVDLKKYAKGTPQGGHTGGLAMVNDAKSNKYRELVALPDGRAFVPQGRNVVMDLPKGSSVLRGDKTHAAMQNGLIPRYEGGTGWLEKSFNWAKEKMLKVKDWTTDIWDIATDPSKMKEILANFVNTALPGNLTNGILPDAVGGLVNKVMDAAKDFLFSEKEAMELAQGEFHWDGHLEKDPTKVGAGGGPQGLMNYVYEIFKNNLLGKFKIKGFGGFSDRNMVGGSSKSMHAYGRAIDIFTASNSPDAEKKKIAEASRRLPLLQYAIYNKKWTKPGSGWSNYMKPGRNPHTDHVHIDFKAPTAANLSELGGAIGSTANVSGGARAWTAQIKKAHKVIYGTAISKNGLAEVLEQIQTESSGSAMAKQGIIDKNSFNGSGGSKGLLQFIQSTFDYYKVKGHGNIWSGYDQLLAMFNVPNWYTRITEHGRGKGWIPSGVPVKKYAQGGIIDKAHIGMVGEAGPEAIIPLSQDKRGRAMQLLAQAGQYMGMDSSATRSSSGDNKVLALLAEQVNLLSQQVALLTGIATKDTAIVVDGREIAKAVNKVNKIDERRNARVKGLTT